MLALCCAAICQAGPLTPSPMWQNDNIYISYDHFVDHVVLDGQTYFRMTHDASNALWRTDGTLAATRVIYPRDLIGRPFVADQKIWFLVDHAHQTTQLMAFDPLSDTLSVALTLAGSIDTSRQFLRGTTLYFNDGNMVYSIDLAAPTTPTYVADADWWTLTGDYLLTQTPDTHAFNVHNLLTQTIYTQGTTASLQVTEMGGLIYFMQGSSPSSSQELYRTNGSESGTETVLDAAHYPLIQRLEELVAADSSHVFLRIRYTRPDNRTTINQLIALDGTANSFEMLPALVRDSRTETRVLATAAPDGFGIYYLTPADAPVYSDGTAKGTRQIAGAGVLSNPGIVHSLAWGNRTLLQYAPTSAGRPSTVYTTDTTSAGTDTIYHNDSTPQNVQKLLRVVDDRALVVVRANNRSRGDEKDTLG